MLLILSTMDEYCERTAAGLLAEPLNAFSNASFLIAAWAAWTLAERAGKSTFEILALIALWFSVGVGSILWHTYPTNTTLMLDIIPIVLFIMWFIWAYTRKVAGMRSLAAAGAVASFLAATYFAVSYTEFLHGALVYTPGLVVVLLLGIYHALAQKPARYLMLSTAGVYFTALVFRTLDQEVCNLFTTGTHFVWHSLIGLVTYMAMRALILGHSSDSDSEKRRRKVVKSGWNAGYIEGTTFAK
jgi:hypothetical protein